MERLTDEQLREAGIASGGNTGDSPGPPITDPREAMEAAAEREPEKIDPVTHMAAADWFLDEEAIQDESTAKAIVPVNTASAGRRPRIVDFVLQVLDRDRIREIREECTDERANGTREVNDMEANLRMVTEALLDPPIRTDAAYRTVRGQTFLDPADALKARFIHKPGLIDQLAGKLTEISGYNTNDVKEVRAAGN